MPAQTEVFPVPPFPDTTAKISPKHYRPPPYIFFIIKQIRTKIKRNFSGFQMFFIIINKNVFAKNADSPFQAIG